MFTGIIEEIGEVTRVERDRRAARITVRGPAVVSDARRGDSIAVSGVCLTVTESTAEAFTADVMAETLDVTTLARAAAGTRVNLERAARLGDRLGGHLVQGHVDGTAGVADVTEGEAWRVVRLRPDPALAPLIARKGSVALDGASLTVSAVGRDDAGDWFEVSLIPETLAATTLGERAAGDTVNIETDILARHVERMVSFTETRNGS